MEKKSHKVGSTVTVTAFRVQGRGKPVKRKQITGKVSLTKNKRKIVKSGGFSRFVS